jgi:hypothetical protein
LPLIRAVPALIGGNLTTSEKKSPPLEISKPEEGSS